MCLPRGNLRAHGRRSVRYKRRRRLWVSCGCYRYPPPLAFSNARSRHRTQHFATQLADGGNSDVYETMGTKDAISNTLGPFLNSLGYIRSERPACDKTSDDSFFICLNEWVNTRGLCIGSHILIFQRITALSMEVGWMGRAGQTSEYVIKACRDFQALDA
jgi:hypothetical protein